MSYELLKTLHIIAMVSWFAGLFYIPRLFVYHTMEADDPRGNERFKIMERRLYKAIMVPAMIVTLICGGLLWWKLGYGRESGWLHAKMTLVFFLVVYHFYCGFFVHDFARDQNKKSEKFFRVFNEVPTLILIAIVSLTIFRPF